MTNEIAVNVLGTIGTVLWCIQLVPQIIRNFKVKDCTGVPPTMMFLWSACGVPFSIYFFGIDGSIPLRIQPQLFTFCCIITWAQTLYYPPVQMKKFRFMAYVGLFVLVAIGLETGLILWLRPLYRKGKTWPMLLVGAVASVLLTLGLVPPYIEIYKRRGRVVGINFFFLGMDSAGAFFSMMSVVVGEIDIMSLVLYALVLAMEIGIFGIHIFWYLTGGRRILREEKLVKQRQKEEGEEAKEEGEEAKEEGEEAKEEGGEAKEVKEDSEGLMILEVSSSQIPTPKE